jgi:phosphoserine aminotransferase
MAGLFNFSGGPGALPPSVLRQLSAEILDLDGSGLSLLGVSHRSDWFREVVAEAEKILRDLVGIPQDYQILFLQGGASLQFSMIAMTLLRGTGKAADYLETGYWSAKSIPEAKREGAVRLAWSGREQGYRRLPEPAELQLSPDAAYLHYISNETVEGLQFQTLPGLPGVPRVCDMSSDFLSRPVRVTDYQAIYAHAQKNMGPAGVTLVVLHDDVVARSPEDVPSVLNYRKHVESHSIYNTPPVFAIYAVLLVLHWLQDEIGGLAAMDARNRRKAAALYAAIDAEPGFYRPHAAVADRSLMNAAFRLPSPALDALFVAEAERAGLQGLGGHRSIGGVRASLYNAVSFEAVTALCDFMGDFRARHG